MVACKQATEKSPFPRRTLVCGRDGVGDSIIQKSIDYNVLLLALVKKIFPDGDAMAVFHTLFHRDLPMEIAEQVDEFLIQENKREQFDFINHYQELLNFATTHRNSVVTTPQEIVDYLVKKLMLMVPDYQQETILDLASGGGNFFMSLLKEIRAQKKDRGEWTRDDASIALSRLHAIEINEHLVDFHKIRLYAFLKQDFGENESLELVQKARIACGDALGLLDNLFSTPAFQQGQFDFVISNPPYVTYGNMAKDEKKRLQKLFPEIYTGLNDLSYYFLYQGLRFLKKGGTALFLTSRYFIEARYAGPLREKILEHTIAELIDIPFSNIFNKGVNSAIIVVKKAKAAGNEIKIQKIKASKDNYQLLGMLHENDYFVKNQEELSGDPWLFVDEVDDELIGFFNKDSCTLGEVAKLGTGFHTGLDEVFIGNITCKDGAYFGKTPSGDLVEVEKERIVRSIKTKEIHPYYTEFKGRYLLFIYRTADTGAFPKAMRYLKHYEPELKKRYDFANNGIYWYEIAQVRNMDIFDSHVKILCPYKAVEPRFALDRERYFTSIDVSLIKPLKIDPLVLLAYLNHPAVKKYIKLTAKKLDGKKVELYPEYLKHIPVKNVFLEKNNPAVLDIINKLEKIESFSKPFSKVELDIVDAVERAITTIFQDGGLEYDGT